MCAFLWFQSPFNLRPTRTAYWQPSEAGQAESQKAGDAQSVSAATNIHQFGYLFKRLALLKSEQFIAAQCYFVGRKKSEHCAAHIIGNSNAESIQKMKALSETAKLYSVKETGPNNNRRRSGQARKKKRGSSGSIARMGRHTVPRWRGGGSRGE
jgi:predicted phosphoadenosine phosphosulfate sulfurtransferase